MIFTKFCPDIDLIGLRSTTCDFQPAYSPPEKGNLFGMVVYGSEQFKQRNFYVQHLDDGWGKRKSSLREIFFLYENACAIKMYILSGCSTSIHWHVFENKMIRYTRKINA